MGDIDNIINKSRVEQNLQIISLHIAVFEGMKNFVVSNIRYFYCMGFHYEDGRYIEHIDPKYNQLIKDRIVDDKGNKDITKASFLLLQDWGFITSDDYELFVKVKNTRNDFAHEMIKFIVNGIEEIKIQEFIEMVELYRRITNKWFVDIEASVAGINLDNVDCDDICTINNAVFDIILNTLYGNGKK